MEGYMSKRWVFSVLLILALLVSYLPAAAASPNTMIGINVLLKEDASPALLADLGKFGKVRDVLYEIDALTMQVRSGDLASIQALPYVAAANPDAKRNGAPVDTVAAEDFMDGRSTWDLDAVNVTVFGDGREVSYDGTGVYVAVVDTGLLDSWRQYFPEERIAEEYGIAFGGGGGEVGFVSSQPNKWEHDQNSHGTHVTSTILGYQRTSSLKFNGVAPMVTIIPVKVLNQNGSGWSSVVARGITYVADLKAGPLAGHPVVINMSLGGPTLDAMEKAAVDYAIEKGVIVVASAGNEGEAGMGYPGAYAPVISVAASGWVGEWKGQRSDPSLSSYYRYWWYLKDVFDPTDTNDFYITDFSSRELAGQDLDVAAPGSWIVGPYQVNSGQLSFYFLGGTSMASPHVAGIAALMAQKDPSLTGPQAEEILEASAIALPAGCRDITGPGSTEAVPTCWEADATGAGLTTANAALAATP
jgi:subtilisin family serine protease